MTGCGARADSRLQVDEKMHHAPDLTTLPVPWRRWIVDNLLRGCTLDSMVDAMAGQEFDRATATGHVRQIACACGLPQHDAAPAPEPRVTSPDTAETDPADQPALTGAGRDSATAIGDLRVSLRMRDPVLAVVDDILSAAQCDELIRLARAKLTRSTVVDPGTGQEKVIAQRSSSGTFFTRGETDFVNLLERRLGLVGKWPVENSEGLQILNYQVGGEYQPHFDYFPPADPGSAAHLAKGGQRVSTLVVYLNNVAAGGETVFPELGLSITPRQGSAVYFEYCNDEDQLDARTLHGGAPVLAGEKWIATRWTRQRRYG